MTAFRVPGWYRWLGIATRPLARVLCPQRLGPWVGAGPRPVWIHAASLGELKGSLRLAGSLPHGTPLFLTSTTTSGLRKLRAERPDLPSSLLPLDDQGTVRRFLESIGPRCAIFLESEAWPAALQVLSELRIPASFVAFRTGPDAQARWRRFSRLFPGWTRTVDAIWTDRPDLPEFVTEMGFNGIRPGASLKWAGSTPASPRSEARHGAALSIHLRDLPQIRRLFRGHPETGWLWFPRHMYWNRLLDWYARSLGARIVSVPTPGPGEIWIAPRFGMVRALLPTCQTAWVSPGHDTDEPFHCGVRRVLTGSPAIEAPGAGVDAERTLRQIRDWIPRS